MRRTYYELKTRVRPGFALPVADCVKIKKDVVTGTVGTLTRQLDPPRWIDPPHVALANLGYENPKHLATVEQARWFVTRYGPPLSDEHTMFIPGGWDTFEISVGEFNQRQDQLRYAWKNRDAKPLLFGWGFENADLFYLPARWTPKGVELCPAECWTYMQLLLTRDIVEGRARICAKPDCITPFFVAKRNNRKYCYDSDCANNMAQRNFRRRNKR